MFALVAALGVATAPVVDLNSFPTDLSPVEFTTTRVALVDHPYVLMPIAYEHYSYSTTVVAFN